MKLERMQHLAALHAVGALSEDELKELQGALAAGDAEVKALVAKFHDLAALVATAMSPPHDPPPGGKEKLLARLGQRSRDTLRGLAESEGARLIRGDDEMGWQKLPIPGAWAKVLSRDASGGYAIILGKLEAGARYPAHRHFGTEDLYMLTGDLHIGEVVLHAGDFHHADASTIHGVNYSEHGCTLLAVVSTQDLLAQNDPNSAKWVGI